MADQEINSTAPIGTACQVGIKITGAKPHMATKLKISSAFLVPTRSDRHPPGKEQSAERKVLVHQSLDVLDQVVEPAVQVIGKVLNIFPSRSLTLFFFEHLEHLRDFGDVVALILVLWIIDPLVNFPIGVVCPLLADFGVFFE